MIPEGDWIKTATNIAVDLREFELYMLDCRIVAGVLIPEPSDEPVIVSGAPDLRRP